MTTSATVNEDETVIYEVTQDVDHYVQHRLLCCYRDGYTEAQIMAVSERYDIDVGHGVSRAELRKMQADLGSQKVRLVHGGDMTFFGVCALICSCCCTQHMILLL